MKKVLFAICLSLLACEQKEEEKPKVHQEAPKPPPPPPVIPVATNPFEKPPPPPPAPVHAAFQPPHWVMVGEFKMNDSWSIWTWRDEANHNTCYFYNVMGGGQLLGHGVSCVKE